MLFVGYYLNLRIKNEKVLIKPGFDEMEIINITSDGIIPWRISCELSEDEHYYDCRMYFDAMEDTKVKEVIVTPRLRPQDLLYRFEPMPSDEHD